MREEQKTADTHLLCLYHAASWIFGRGWSMLTSVYGGNEARSLVTIELLNPTINDT